MRLVKSAYAEYVGAAREVMERSDNAIPAFWSAPRGCGERSWIWRDGRGPVGGFALRVNDRYGLAFELCGVFGAGGTMGATVAEASRIASEVMGARVLTLNCFAPLARVYERYGFVTVWRAPFDDGLAPLDWDYTRHGRPDLHVMIASLRSINEQAFN